MAFYSVKEIDKTGAHYRMIIGERSNGKTYSVLSEVILKNYVNNNEQGAILRRYMEDFKGLRGKNMFADIVANGRVFELTAGKWTDIVYKNRAWWLCKYDEELDDIITDVEPFCYSFVLAQMEHDKGSGTGYPKVTTIMFDEFISRVGYLNEEFMLFVNCVSNIVRLRDNVVIYMLGNTVNRYCPYFEEMGLYNVKNMKQGTIDVYTYGESALKVAVEYCANNKKNKKSKPSDVFFAFNNPKLKMLTTGIWEIDIYPHLPEKYTKEQVKLRFFIEFDKECVMGEVIRGKQGIFIYITRKTTPIKNDKDIVYSFDYSPNPYRRRNILKPQYKFEHVIYDLFKYDKVFYQDNMCGELVRNYLMNCKKSK